MSEPEYLTKAKELSRLIREQIIDIRGRTTHVWRDPSKGPQGQAKDKTTKPQGKGRQPRKIKIKDPKRVREPDLEAGRERAHQRAKEKWEEREERRREVDPIISYWDVLRQQGAQMIEQLRLYASIPGNKRTVYLNGGLPPGTTASEMPATGAGRVVEFIVSPKSVMLIGTNEHSGEKSFRLLRRVSMERLNEVEPSKVKKPPATQEERIQQLKG